MPRHRVDCDGKTTQPPNLVSLVLSAAALLIKFFQGGPRAAMPPKPLNDEGDLLDERPLAFFPDAEYET
jgi:hypothetical protein